jgi:rhodanese-related sulfurtransferase/glutaredoxin
MVISTKFGRWVTDACILGLTALLLVSVALRLYHSSAAPTHWQEIRPGERLSLSGANWAGAARILVIALSSRCPHCQASLPFYRQLSRLAADKGNRLRLAAVGSQPTQDIESYLRAGGVRADEVHQVDFSRIGVTGVPTLILAGRDGMVAGVWVGELSQSREADVIARINGVTNPGPPADASSEYLDESALNRLREQGVDMVILDIRDRSSYASAHRADSTNIPYDEVETRARIEISHRSKVVVDCEQIPGEFCETTAGTLRNLGYSGVSILGRGSN